MVLRRDGGPDCEVPDGEHDDGAGERGSRAGRRSVAAVAARSLIGLVHHEPVGTLAVESPPADGSDVGRKTRLPRYRWAGTVVGLVLAWSSFTPSLLPRSPILQGLLAGIAGAFGYGMGETVAWAVRRLTKWRPTPAARRRAWQVLAVVGGVGSLVMLYAGWRWQVDLHELMGEEAPAAYDSLLIVVLGVLVFVGLVALGRVLRRLTGWLVRHTVGRLPLWLARTIAVTVVVLLVVGVLTGVIFRVGRRGVERRCSA